MFVRPQTQWGYDERISEMVKKHTTTSTTDSCQVTLILAILVYPEFLFKMSVLGNQLKDKLFNLRPITHYVCVFAWV